MGGGRWYASQLRSSVEVNEPLANAVLFTLKINAMQPEYAVEFIRRQNEITRDMAGMPQQEICDFGEALYGQNGTQVPTLLALRWAGSHRYPRYSGCLSQPRLGVA